MMKKIYFLLGIFFLVLTQAVCADTIKIIGAKTVDQSMTYENVLLDLSAGYFNVINNATLEIKNSIINGTISQNNASLFVVSKGKLTLTKNAFNIHVGPDVTPNPVNIFYKMISLNSGDVDMSDNNFDVDQSFSVTLINGSNLSNNRIVVSRNKVNNFHGGLILVGGDNVVVKDNLFSRVSSSNIYLLDSQHILLENNKSIFAANGNIGDAIDIINSNDFVIKNNFIGSGGCYGIVILGGINGVIELNHIVSGITYAIYINSSFGGKSALLNLGNSSAKNINYNNKNITITKNYISQNRYGLAAIDVDTLIVKENIFIQKFPDNSTRKFWTDNQILLTNVSNLIWKNNLYKEAYSQDNEDGDAQSNYFVTFPIYNGVVL